MEGINKYNSLSEIPENGRNYIGYYWLSDSKTPCKIDGHNYKIASINPFVMEAMLWDADNEISIMVKHTGKYWISAFDLKEIRKIYGNDALHSKQYLPHRLSHIGEIKKVKFEQLWLPESDALCEGEKVLKLKAILFTGFKN